MMYQKSYIIYSGSLHIPGFWHCKDYYKTRNWRLSTSFVTNKASRGENPLHCLLRDPFGWTVLIFTEVLFLLMLT